MDDYKNFINQLSIDCVIFGYKEKKLKVLVTKLKLHGDLYALPSGFIKRDEGIDQAAHRILKERTNIKNICLDQFRVFGDVPRDNSVVIDRIFELNKEDSNLKEVEKDFFLWLKQRFISIGYYALVNADEVIPSITFLDESADWYDIGNLPKMVLDHNHIVAKALEALRVNFDDRLMGFNLLPEKFTMKELQKLYEIVYDKPFRSNNFQKKMLDLNVLERLEKKFTGAANKAPYLYRFKS